MLNQKTAMLGNYISVFNICLKDGRLNPELHMYNGFTKVVNAKRDSFDGHEESCFKFKNSDYWLHIWWDKTAPYNFILKSKGWFQND